MELQFWDSDKDLSLSPTWQFCIHNILIIGAVIHQGGQTETWEVCRMPPSSFSTFINSVTWFCWFYLLNLQSISSVQSPWLPHQLELFLDISYHFWMAFTHLHCTLHHLILMPWGWEPRHTHCCTPIPSTVPVTQKQLKNIELKLSTHRYQEDGECSEVEVICQGRLPRGGIFEWTFK